MFNFSIEKQINILLLVLSVTVFCSLFGMYELKKAGALTYLEREHLEAFYLTKRKIDILTIGYNNDDIVTESSFFNKSASVDNREQLGLYQTIDMMHEQAKKCLDIVFPPEALLFRILGYGEALDLCADEVSENKKFRAILDDYIEGDLDVIGFINSSKITLKKNQFNSARFSVLIPEIISLINNIMFTLVITVSAIALLLFYLFSKKLKKNLKILHQGLGEISRNKLLNWKFNTTGKNEVVDVARNIENMLEQYATVISKIYDVAEIIRTNSYQLSQYSQDNVNRITEQVSNTEQAATAANEITATIQDISNNSDIAATSSNKAQKYAKDGDKLVREAEDNIRVLNDSIDKASLAVQNLAKKGDDISGISDVILSIADQTNLLALNAAIEAARAGEHGRGFAVVAGEVRDLASRTQQSTEEIRLIVESFQNSANQAIILMRESQDRSNLTLSIALNAGKELSKINSISSQTSDISYQVASAIEEQTSVVEEVSKNITEIGRAAEELGLSSKSTNQTAVEMSEVAVVLNDLVNQFKKSE